MNQWPQFLGAFLLLAAYALAQSGRLNVMSLSYNLVNVFGSLLLATDAWRAQQWGFVLLEPHAPLAGLDLDPEHRADLGPRTRSGTEPDTNHGCDLSATGLGTGRLQPNRMVQQWRDLGHH